MTVTDIQNILWKYKRPLALFVAIVVLLCHFYLEFAQTHTATVYIKYVGENAENGQAANGSVLKPYEITDSYVVGETLKQLGINAEVKIAYVGTQCSGRGIEELISAVVQDSRFELHIGGYGPLDEMIRSAAQQCNRIHFYGKLPYAQTLSLEEQCDLMVALYDPEVANHHYCAPNKLYESLMLGKPLLMCEHTGWDRLFQEEKIGYLIPYSLEGIAQGLNKLYEAKDQWPTMSEAGKRLYQQRYSWETMKQRIRKLYTEIQ